MSSEKYTFQNQTPKFVRKIDFCKPNIHAVKLRYFDTLNQTIVIKSPKYCIYVSTSTTIRLSSTNVEVIRKQSITNGLGTEIRGCNWPYFENSKHVLQDGRGLCGTLFILSSHQTHITPNMLIPIPNAKCRTTVYEPIFGGRKKPTWLLFEHD